MISLNTYASKVFSEHPIGVWPLDVFEDDKSPSYSTSSPFALVHDSYSTGLPLVYGSTKSIRIFNAGDNSIIDREYRTWERVKKDPDSGREEKWGNWKGTTDYDKLRYEDYFEQVIAAPSILHYGYGMFTEEGKYNAYTAEMWIRIDPRVEEAKKIWGTPDTYDGLWVNDNYITLVVGDQHKSYSIENWYRPMLLNVIYTPTQSRLLINGQEVIKVEYDPTSFKFETEGEYETTEYFNYNSALEYNSLTPFNAKIDGIVDDESQLRGNLAFMSYEDIHLFEVDAISLFSYSIPDDVAKRRFVWGQGVPENNIFSSAYETQVAYLDFPFAEYANNVIYPDLWNWDSGYLDGFISNRSTLKTPDYSLPEIVMDGRNLDALYLENLYRNNEEGKETFFSFKPEYDWDQQSYFFFDTINKLTEPVQAVYGVFKHYDYSDGKGKQPLFKFAKKFSKDIVTISVDNEEVIYEINDSEFDRVTISFNTKFSAGLDFNKILKGDNALLKNFFSNTSDIQMFAMGDGETTFEGSMTKISICDTSNMARKETENNFKDNGVIEQSAVKNYGTYNLMPFQRYAEFWLDVGANAYWEDSVALTTLGKNVRIDETTWVPSLEFFQINIGYDGDYLIDENNEFDFSQSELKTYITFQPITSLVNKPLKEFTETKKLAVDRCVDPTSIDLEKTKFEVMNGTVVKPPALETVFGERSTNWEDWKVVIYFDVEAEGVIKAPFEIKNLSLAGQAYNEESNVGSRYGARLNSKSMFAIYKENTPYLYLTKDSGIECLRMNDGDGVRVPFNKNEVEDFRINNLNFFVKTNYHLMGENLLEIDGRFQKYYLKKTQDNEFTVVDNNGEFVRYLKIYKNGELIKDFGEDETNPTLDNPLILEENQWAMIGMEFGSPVVNENYSGAIVLHPGGVFQNIAISKISTTEISATAIIRTWGDVKTEEDNWEEWKGTGTEDEGKPGFSYLDLISSENYLTYPVSPKDIFALYTGTSNIVIDDNSKLDLVSTKGIMLTDVNWVTYDRQPS